jgi:hypothetical protein
MKFLIRFISRNAAGGTEHHDRLVDSRIVTIGRATGRMLHLQDGAQGSSMRSSKSGSGSAYHDRRAGRRKSTAARNATRA